MKKINGFEIAEEIFSNGRIDNPEDWDEMQVELGYELSQAHGLEADTKEYKDAIEIVRERWYPES